MKIWWLIPITFLLAGCASSGTGSILGGQCNLPGVHTPDYAVRGKTKYDQNWADDVTEGLVRGCNQPRPKARPASLDKPRHRIVKKKPVAPMPAAAPLPENKPELIAPAPKKGWWQRKKKPPAT